MKESEAEMYRHLATNAEDSQQWLKTFVCRRKTTGGGTSLQLHTWIARSEQGKA